MAIVQEVHLTQDKKRIAPVVYAVQNDTGRDLKMVVDDETLVAGMTGKLAFERPDGTYYEASGTLDTATNSFTAEEDQALTKAGTVRCQLKVYDALDDLVSSFFFSISVEPDASGSLTEQEGWTVKEAIDTATQAQALAEEAMEDLVDLKKTFAPLITETVSDQAIASFDDGAENWPVKDLQVAITATQDLHGYDNPWPAGGGKNLLEITATTQTVNDVIFTINTDSAGNVESITANGTATATIYFRLKSYFKLPVGEYICTGCPSGGGTSSYWMGIYADGAAWKGNDTGSGRTFTVNTDYIPQNNDRVEIGIASGVTVNNMVFKPMIRLSSVSDATFAPYSNICPISGFSQANVTRTGKNLLKLSESEMESVGWYRLFPITVKAGTYIISCENKFGKNGSEGASISFADENNNTIGNALSSYAFGDSVFVGTAQTFTAEQAAKIKKIKFGLQTGSTTFAEIAQGNIQLELGSTATAYEPYNGQTVTIDLDGTRYGGTLDVTSGKLTIDTVYAETDMSTASYTEATNTKFFQRNVFPSGSEVVGGSGAVGNPKYKCNIAPYAYNIDDYVHWYAASNSRQIRCYVPKDLDVTGMTAQFTGVLVNPVEVDLTPTELETVLGTNNIFCDTNGNVSVTYGADTALYIQKLISALA